jgi:hypothetical protein
LELCGSDGSIPDGWARKHNKRSTGLAYISIIEIGLLYEQRIKSMAHVEERQQEQPGETPIVLRRTPTVISVDASVNYI